MKLNEYNPLPRRMAGMTHAIMTIGAFVEFPIMLTLAFLTFGMMTRTIPCDVVRRACRRSPIGAPIACRMAGHGGRTYPSRMRF
jgi:hypothetical protein